MYQHKDLYTLDFTNVNSYFEMHKVIKKELDFPDYYGENWDALWDCLTDMVGDKLCIEIIGFGVIEKTLGNKAEILLDILRELKHCYDDEYADSIIIEIVDGETRIAIE